MSNTQNQELMDMLHDQAESIVIARHTEDELNDMLADQYKDEVRIEAQRLWEERLNKLF